MEEFKYKSIVFCSACTMSSVRKFTFAISSPDEFLVNLAITSLYAQYCVLHAQDLHVDVVAVLNDTTGTLLAGSYLDKHCGIGLIMGITSSDTLTLRM